jgi:hypothetical protein
MSENPEITRTITDQEYLATGHTIGMHEVLHGVSIVRFIAQRYLQEHPAVQDVPLLKASIDRICCALARLYQDVGSWPEFLAIPDVTLERAEKIAASIRQTLDEQPECANFLIDRTELVGMLALMDAYILATPRKDQL